MFNPKTTLKTIIKPRVYSENIMPRFCTGKTNTFKVEVHFKIAKKIRFFSENKVEQNVQI